jgi:2-amino-4-hydroxy-6-hydroxymethyldihydropteridine diphosphokinase
MKTLQHQTLIHLTTDLVGGTALAQVLIKEIGRIGQVLTVSTVYKRFSGRNRIDLNATIETVLYYRTDCAVDELLWHFRQYTKEVKAQLVLLCYDDLVVLSPQLTLPHPSLHTDHLMVRCASEALPTYEHPIIQRTLAEIAGQALPAIDAEFFLQGKTLVDFPEDES